MRKIFLLCLFLVPAWCFADQLSHDEIERRKTKESTTIIRFDIARNGREAAVTMENSGETDFSWRASDLTCVNEMGDTGEITDAQNINPTPLDRILYVYAHEKRMFRVKFTCPATRPAAFIWKN